MAAVELVWDARAVLGEGPLWDTGDGCLWWVDIEQGLVHRYDPAAGTRLTRDVGQKVGTVVRRASGGLVLGLEQGIAAYDFDTGQLQWLAQPEADVSDHRFNDGKCDPAGRFWAGTLNQRDETQPEGVLYSLDATGTLHQHVDGLRVSNGIVWTSDHQTMYFIDSPTRRVDAFDYDLRSGQIKNRRSVIEFEEGLGFPDGMTIDKQDFVWVAMWSGHCVVRCDPRTGKCVQRIDIPASQVTACALGGSDLSELFVTTARRGLSDAELADQPQAGGLFRVRVDVPGVPAVRFSG